MILSAGKAGECEFMGSLGSGSKGLGTFSSRVRRGIGRRHPSNPGVVDFDPVVE